MTSATGLDAYDTTMGRSPSLVPPENRARSTRRSQSAATSTSLARSRGPERLPAMLGVLAERGDRGQQEREPRRGGARVLHHEHALVLGPGEIKQRLRQRRLPLPAERLAGPGSRTRRRSRWASRDPPGPAASASGTSARAAGWYASKMPASSARDRNVVSTPYSTSPSGRSPARIAWLTMEPASPPGRTLTSTPVCAVERREHAVA